MYPTESPTFYPTTDPTTSPTISPTISNQPSLFLLFPTTRKPTYTPTKKPVWLPIFSKASKSKSGKGKSGKTKSSKAFHGKSSKWSKYGKSYSSSGKSGKGSWSEGGDLQYLQVYTDFTPIGEKSSGLSRRNSGIYSAVSILILSAIFYAVL